MKNKSTFDQQCSKKGSETALGALWELLWQQLGSECFQNLLFTDFERIWPAVGKAESIENGSNKKTCVLASILEGSLDRFLMDVDGIFESCFDQNCDQNEQW